MKELNQSELKQEFIETSQYVRKNQFVIITTF